MTDSFRYEPFGAIRGEVSTGQIGNGFAFAGEYADAETGFYNLRARTYDPGTGRFLQPDPLGVPGQSPYAYVSNNPVAFVDPSGLHCDPFDPGLFDVLFCKGTDIATELEGKGYAGVACSTMTVEAICYEVAPDEDVLYGECGITFDHIIVVASDPFCGGLENECRVAHELVHVQQQHEIGFYSSANLYYKAEWFIPGPNPYEEEAYAMEDYCDDDRYIVDEK